MPEAIWAKAGIADEELAAWPSTLIHAAAPDAFRAKTLAVRAAYHNWKTGLLEGGANDAAAKPPDAAPAPKAGKAPGKTG